MKWMVKFGILVTVLFMCVIGGMMFAKQQMLDMSAVKDRNNQAIDFNVDFFEKDKAKMHEVAKHSKSLDERLAKMENIQSANPYGDLGKTLSDGLKGLLGQGLALTSELFGKVIHAVL